MIPRSLNIFGDKTGRALGGMLAPERLEMYRKAVDYANYELVPGDIVEFGVFTGRTLAAFAHALSASQYDIPFARRVRGFDSFAGLPASADPHPRWQHENCDVNHLRPTPSLRRGGAVHADAVRGLFQRLNLSGPVIHEGAFTDTIPAAIPAECSAAAVIHIDCDIYESAREALFGIEPAMQDGAVLLMDDWFHYRADPHRGEQRAFGEFLAAFPYWHAADYGNYGIFCKAFILSRRD